MNFLYPRVVSISRPVANGPSVGNVGYNTDTGPTNETVIATDLQASIQLDRVGQRNPMGLPTDAPSAPTWKLMIPGSAAPLGTINSGDVVTDDLGVRYKIAAPYWNSMGYACRMTVLEV